MRVLTKWVLPVVLGVVLVLVLLCRPSHEVEYRGRTLSAWLDRLQSTNATESAESKTAVQGIGTNALPTLVTWLSRRDSFMKRKFMSFLIRAGVPLWDRSTGMPLWDHFSEHYYRRKALLGFRTLGTEADASVPALNGLLTNPDVRFEAAVALTYVAPGIAQQMTSGWSTNGDRGLRTDSLRLLQELIDQKTYENKL